MNSRIFRGRSDRGVSERAVRWHEGKTMRLLTIESTCDETAAAVVTDQLEILGSVVASQDELHAAYDGVVPEIAARAHLDRILPVIQSVLQRADTPAERIDAIAVATAPGLAGSLLIGLVAAKTLAWLWNRPLIAVDHLQAHVYACRIAAQRDIFPCVGFVVSGGHTHLFHCRSALEFETLGGTIDDAAGEAFDKVAAMLGLPYPGGARLAALADRGDRAKYRFPRPLLDDSRLAFSFSGLKTAVRYAIAGPGRPLESAEPLTETARADLAASFQEAAVDCLVGKGLQACRSTGMRRLCVGGGVAANRRFRERLTAACDEAGIETIIAPLEWCTDNAVMGALAFESLRAGRIAQLDLDIVPGLVRQPIG